MSDDQNVERHINVIFSNLAREFNNLNTTRWNPTDPTNSIPASAYSFPPGYAGSSARSSGGAVPRAHMALQSLESRKVTDYYNDKRRYHLQGGGNLCSTTRRRRIPNEDEIEVGTPRSPENYSPSRSTGTSREDGLSPSGVPPSFQGVEMTMDGQPIDIDPTVRGIPVDNATLNEARRIWNDNINQLPASDPIQRTLNMIRSEDFPFQLRHLYLAEYERCMFNYIEHYRNSRVPLDERVRHCSFYIYSLRIAFNRLK
jgi:hypothetical protein